MLQIVIIGVNTVYLHALSLQEAGSFDLAVSNSYYLYYVRQVYLAVDQSVADYLVWPTCVLQVSDIYRVA